MKKMLSKTGVPLRKAIAMGKHDTMYPNKGSKSGKPAVRPKGGRKGY